MEGKHNENIEAIDKHKKCVEEVYEYYSRSRAMTIEYKGEGYSIDYDGPGLSVRKSYDNTGDPIFTMPLDTPLDVFLDSFMLEGKSFKQRFEENDENLKIWRLY